MQVQFELCKILTIFKHDSGYLTSLSLLSYNMLGVLVVVGTLKLIKPHQYPPDLLRVIGKKHIFINYIRPIEGQNFYLLNLFYINGS
jgi:hypothetical protein